MKILKLLWRKISKIPTWPKRILKRVRAIVSKSGKLVSSVQMLRSGSRRMWRNPDASKARAIAASIQAEFARQGIKSEVRYKPFLSKKTKTVIRYVSFVPPLAVTTDGNVVLKIKMPLPAPYKVRHIDDPDVIKTLAHRLEKDVIIDSGDNKRGTIIIVADKSTDGIPRLVWSHECAPVEEKPLAFAVGRGRGGNVYVDLESMPHYLVAGPTRQGKSVHMWHVICTLALRNHPDSLKMALFDLKRGAMFYPLRSLPHLLFPVVDDMDKVIPALDGLLQEMDQRYVKIRARGQATVGAYNRLPDIKKIPLVVVAMDELAEITRSEHPGVRKEGTMMLTKLLRQSAGAGIHVMVSTQYPNSNVLKGEIKGNLPEAIAFRCVSRHQSEIIIGHGGAEKLPKVKGRALLKYGAELVEVQTPLVKEGSGAHGIYATVSAIVSKWADIEAQMIDLAESQEAIQDAVEEKLNRDLVAYAVQFLDGEFKVRDLYKVFRGRVSKHSLTKIAQKLEADGVLSPSVGRSPRRVINADLEAVGAENSVGLETQADKSQEIETEDDETVSEMPNIDDIEWRME